MKRNDRRLNEIQSPFPDDLLENARSCASEVADALQSWTGSATQLAEFCEDVATQYFSIAEEAARIARQQKNH